MQEMEAGERNETAGDLSTCTTLDDVKDMLVRHPELRPEARRMLKAQVQAERDKADDIGVAEWMFGLYGTGQQPNIIQDFITDRLAWHSINSAMLTLDEECDAVVRKL